ncbi:hydroxymethylglutaryl-CoA lyase [Glaciecola sp. 2405UD65-10]|uniref:hydroxymethylglutaryl-CoA lyase n=1 Tax=Glaciecola sp. 2405UD65-10 TaxID=3397244 RepID=UPI003B5A3DCC
MKSTLFDDIPHQVEVVEVGPRDGLQNEKSLLSVNQKIDLINQLSDCGFSHIESGSFVSAKWVPQMSSSADVMRGIKKFDNIVYSALTPNLKGYHDAINASTKQVAIFASASQTFSQKNINCSIEESLVRFEDVVQQAVSDNIPVRAYVSCVLGCPYEGTIDKQAVLDLSLRLLEMGCYEVSLGDTIGVGTPLNTNKLLNLLLSRISATHLALHCHDTYGQALANVLVGLQQGISSFDSSVAGLGGCPYAAGASGNLASEDLIYMLHEMGVTTGVNLTKLINVGNNISEILQRPNQSKTGKALAAGKL